MVGDGPQNGPAIKEFRKWTGRTQEEIAVLVGIDQTYLSLIELEGRPAPDELTDALADALNVNVDALLRKARPRPKPEPCTCGAHTRRTA